MIDSIIKNHESQTEEVAARKNVHVYSGITADAGHAGGVRCCTQRRDARGKHRGSGSTKIDVVCGTL